MLSLRSLSGLVCLVGLGTVAMVPQTADACLPDPCTESNRWTFFELVPTVVATDGVVRIDGRQNNPESLEAALAFVQLEVTDQGGLLAEGSLEYQPDANAIVWRPTTPLTASEIYDVAILIDNDALAAALDLEGLGDEGCAENIEAQTSFQVSGSALPAFAVPDPAFESAHDVRALESLGSMVCCDGAFPQQDVPLCAGEPDVYWDDGHCASTEGYGLVRATESFAEGTFAADVVADLALRLVQTDGPRARHATPGQLSVWVEDDEPFCARLEVVSLATGDSFTGPEHCYGDELLDQLGRHDVDPNEALGVCAGQPYTCGIQDEGWNPNDCEPWGDPPGEDESGSSGGSGDAGDDAGDSGSGGGEDSNGSSGPDGPGQDDDGLIDSGCACRTHSDDSMPVGLWLLLTGLVWRRTRRRRSR